MTGKKKDEDDDRRSDKRRQILMPIHEEQRRGRDRRKAWELGRSSKEIDPLPMARLSGPAATVRAPTPAPREGPVVRDSPPARPPAPATVKLAPPSGPSPVAPPSPDQNSEPARRNTTARPRPSGIQHVTVPPLPLPARANPPAQSRPTKPTRIGSAAPPKPVGASPRPAVLESKPAPARSPVVRTSPQPTAPPRPRQRSTYAEGELWIGVQEDGPGAIPAPAPEAETHRLVPSGGGERLLVTLCHGPAGTLYRAWRPVTHQVKPGRFLKVEGQTYQQIGSAHRTEEEDLLARQTIFSAFPELKEKALARGAEVITIDV